MKVVYRHYKPNQGLEELPEKIYPVVTGFPAGVSGFPTTADQMRDWFETREHDPKTIRFALAEDGRPLAFVFARDSRSHPGRTHVSYPWALPDCPNKVQEKIFHDLFEYIRKRKDIREITGPVYVNATNAEEQIKFFQRKGFTEKERYCRYCFDFDITETSKWKMTDEVSAFDSRLATIEDLDRLIEICQADPYMRNAFPTQEASRSYFEERVLKDGHAVLILQGDQVIAAGAALRYQPDGLFLCADEERILMRFSATRPGYLQAWKRLLIELAKECLVAGWADIPLRVSFHFTTRSSVAVNLAELRPELEVFEVILNYEE